MTAQDPELSAALGWPGGISDPVLDRKTLLQMVAALRLASQQALDSINELFAAEQSEGGERGGHIRTPATREHLVRVAQARKALHESCGALRAALAQEPPELPLEDALSKAYYYTEEGEWRGSEVRDWDRWHAVAKVAVALIQRPALAESREHITDGTPCWCGSEAVYTDPDTGASVILHKRPQ